MLALVAFGQLASSATLVVDDDDGWWATHDSIQEAMDDAEDGDKIRVYDGVYRENLNHTKSVSVIGNGSARSRIHAIYSGFAIDFVSDGRFSRMNVTMGFGPMMPRLMGSNRIDNCTFHTGSIFIHYSGGWDIDNCTFWDMGLDFDGASDCRIISSTFHRSTIQGWGARNALLAFNKFKDNKSSIRLGVDCGGVTILKNRFLGGGIGFTNIERALVAKNEMKVSGGYISIGRGHNVTISENEMVDGGISLSSHVVEEIPM